LMTKPFRQEALRALILRVLAERTGASGRTPKISPSCEHPA
jgi:hypothetical protein